MTEKNNQRDNNNIAQIIHIKNKNQRNNNTNNNEGVLNIKSKYEITINDEGDIVNPISEDSPKNVYTSGSDDGDRNERCKEKRLQPVISQAPGVVTNMRD